MARTGMYMSDLGMYDSSQEMVLSGIQPLPELEYARDQVQAQTNVNATTENTMTCSTVSSWLVFFRVLLVCKNRFYLF